MKAIDNEYLLSVRPLKDAVFLIPRSSYTGEETKDTQRCS